MSQTLSVILSDEAYRAIQQQAESVGVSTEHVAATSLESTFRHRVEIRTEAEKEAARQRFERHFGEVHSGYATGGDNELIDADLAREYADNHENT